MALLFYDINNSFMVRVHELLQALSLMESV